MITSFEYIFIYFIFVCFYVDRVLVHLFHIFFFSQRKGGQLHRAGNRKRPTSVMTIPVLSLPLAVVTFYRALLLLLSSGDKGEREGK